LRQIRHLDTCDYKTFIDIHLPRVECSFHGFQQEKVLFAEGSAHYTKEFENHVIIALQDSPVISVAKHLDLSWGAIDGIKQRAVERGERRGKKLITDFMDAAKKNTIVVNTSTDYNFGFMDTWVLQECATLKCCEQKSGNIFMCIASMIRQ
jgi:transposase